MFLRILTRTIFGFIISFSAVVLLQHYHFSMDWEQTKLFFSENIQLSILQTGIVFVLFLWFYFILNSSILSGLFIFGISYLIALSSSLKIIFRGEPVFPSDIIFLKDITFFFDIVDRRTLLIIASLVIVLVGALVFYLLKRKKIEKTRTQKVTRVAGVVLSSLFMVNIYHFNQPGSKIKAAFSDHAQWITYNQEKNYKQNGVVSGLLYNLKSPALDKPNDYSRERITEIYEKYMKEANTINESRDSFLADTNVIFIMSETFSDPYRLDGITIKGKDAIESYRNLPGQHGFTLSQVLGGGTANVEFEALTGISQEPLNANISTPFIHLSQQMEIFPSILNYFSNTNHLLTAIHAYDTTMYKRLDNYNALGFEQLIFIEEMRYKTKIERNQYISDESAYKELLAVMDESEEKDFIHMLTMQNHARYENKYVNVQYEVDGAKYNGDVEHYLKGLEYTDAATKELIEIFENYDEKVLLVFWGDHLPGIYGEEVVELNGHRIMHETPLLVYSNFSSKNENLGTVSPIYFTNHVLNLTDTNVTPFNALLQKMEEVLPAFEKNFYLERETAIFEDREELRPGTQLLLKEYDLILYDITTGKNYSKELGFY